MEGGLLLTINMPNVYAKQVLCSKVQRSRFLATQMKKSVDSDSGLIYAAVGSFAS